MSAVQERVLAIVAEVLDVQQENIDGDCSFADDLGADSLDAVELIMALEEEFDYEISDNEAQQIVTVQQVIDYIRERLQ